MNSEELSFLDYDKISDTLMYFDLNYVLNFSVTLTTKRKDGNGYNRCHNEYSFYSEALERESHSIKRNINCYFSIKNMRSFDLSVIIRPKDIIPLKFMMSNIILPWYIGNKSIFGFDNNNKLILKGKFTKQQFPLSETDYIEFIPIVKDYEDGSAQQGCRLIINSADNYMDLDLNKLLEFYYYIDSTDMYNAASNMINYVKTMPYGYNSNTLGNNGEFVNTSRPNNRGSSGNNFFNKI